MMMMKATVHVHIYSFEMCPQKSNVCFWANNAMKLFIYARHKYIKDVISNDNTENMNRTTAADTMKSSLLQLILLFSDAHEMRMVGQFHWKMSNAVGRN